MKSSEFQGVATAVVAVRQDGLGIVFETEPHPQRAKYNVVDYEALEILSKTWDGSSDVQMHFDNTEDKLYIPAELIPTALSFAKDQNFGKS